MSAVDAVLAATALLAGLTGTWSPCGFSMIETIGPTGHTGGMRTTLAACATFLPGALAGGLITFGLLGAAGGLLHSESGAAYTVAALIAVGAALLELRGRRISPQVRRQLPEHWRRVMPMPLAAGLYGVLLGLGFTTFVLSFGVWALAGISFAVGSVQTGLLIGLAFGIGRALPIVVLAPLAGRPAGLRMITLMAERPAIYRGFRFGDAALLGLAGVALATAPGAIAAKSEVDAGADPSVAPDALVWQAPDRSAFLKSHGEVHTLPGVQPAVGGPYYAVIAGDEIRLLNRKTQDQVDSVAVPGADALAVSGSWLAYRVGSGHGDRLKARHVSGEGAIGGARPVAATGASAQLSRPSLDHSLLVYARNGRRSSRILKRRLGTHHEGTLLSSHNDGLFNPSVHGKRLAYVRSVHRRDKVMIRPRRGHGKGRAVYKLRRSRGTIWSTALNKRRVYFTVLRFRGTEPSARILSQRLRGHRHHH